MSAAISGDRVRWRYWSPRSVTTRPFSTLAACRSCSVRQPSSSPSLCATESRTGRSAGKFPTDGREVLGRTVHVVEQGGCSRVLRREQAHLLLRGVVVRLSREGVATDGGQHAEDPELPQCDESLGRRRLVPAGLIRHAAVDPYEGGDLVGVSVLYSRA